jgi:hypothetical protein
MSAKEYVKRISPPDFIDEVGFKTYKLRVRLNRYPESDWIGFFRESSEMKSTEVHPRIVEIDGDEITWTASEDKIPENIEWVDKYISQVNEKYNRLLGKNEEEQQKQEESEKQKQAKLDRLNEKYKDL